RPPSLFSKGGLRNSDECPAAQSGVSPLRSGWPPNRPGAPSPRITPMMRKLCALAIVGCFAAAGWFLWEHTCQQYWLEEQALFAVMKRPTRSPRDEVMALRDHVRKMVRPDKLDREDRSFFRSSAKDILESGEGYCGDATRVFICLAR